MNRSTLASLVAAISAVVVGTQTAHAGKLLVSEVCYDEVGSTFDGEWIELYNGSNVAIDLSNYKIGDEETKGGTGVTEGMFKFPTGASIAPGEVQVVSSYASRFKSLYGFAPAYEVGKYDPQGTDPVWTDDAAVPNMSVYTPWDADDAKLNMSNSNDQFLLLDDSDNAVDAASWGSNFFFTPGLTANQASGQSYERIDPNVDTDSAADWQLGAAPVGASWTSKSSPGTLPVPAVYTWAADGDGVWTIATNWQSGAIPSGADQTAVFGNAIATPRTVSLLGAETVGGLKFDSANAYTIAGTDTLTLDRATGSPTIQVLQGDHTISAPVVFSKSATLDIADGSNLTLTNTVDTSTVSLTKIGNGIATMRGVHATALNVNVGTLAIVAPTPADGTSVVGSLDVTAGAHLNLNDNALIVDYGTSSPLASLSAAIKDGRITASAITAQPTVYTIGILDTATTSGVATFGGTTVDASAILAAVTYKGDANLDHDVDFDDLLVLAKNFNGIGKVMTQGDSDLDGDVDFDDLLSLAKNFNRGTTGSAATADVTRLDARFAAEWALAQSLVPEPTTMAALLGLGISLGRNRRRN